LSFNFASPKANDTGRRPGIVLRGGRQEKEERKGLLFPARYRVMLSFLKLSKLIS
jgi:hypothetical protein